MGIKRKADNDIQIYDWKNDPRMFDVERDEYKLDREAKREIDKKKAEAEREIDKKKAEAEREIDKKKAEAELDNEKKKVEAKIEIDKQKADEEARDNQNKREIEMMQATTEFQNQEHTRAKENANLIIELAKLQNATAAATTSQPVAPAKDRVVHVAVMKRRKSKSPTRTPKDTKNKYRTPLTKTQRLAKNQREREKRAQNKEKNGA